VKLGLDTNVLVYAHMPGFPQHERVRAFLLEQLQRDHVSLVVTAMVLHEFVHVITDPRRFAPPVSMAEALALARGYLGRTNVECLTTDEPALLGAFALLERHGLGLKRIADTLLAATLLRHQVVDFATCNAADFRVFDPSVVDEGA